MNYEYAIKVLRRALSDQEEEIGYANTNIEMISKIIASDSGSAGGYGEMLREEQLRMEKAQARRSDLDLAIETLLSLQEIENFSTMSKDGWRNTAKFKKENEGP